MHETIGHYLLERRIGQGIYGEVFEGHYRPDPSLRVAITILRASLKERPGFVSALKQACEVWSRTEIPSLPRFREIICRSDRVVIVREYLSGSDLGALSSGRTFEAEALENLAHSLLSALAWLHHSGAEHGQIKPGNVFFCEDGRVLFLDTALSQAASVVRFDWDSVRDLGWCAPESCRRGGRPNPGAADVYAMGLLLWSVAAGRAPCPRVDAISQLHWHLTEGPTPLSDLPPWLNAFIARMTAIDLRERPSDAVEALRIFEELRETERVDEVSVRPSVIPIWAKRPDLEGTDVGAPERFARVAFTGIFGLATMVLLLGLWLAHRLVSTEEALEGVTPWEQLSEDRERKEVGSDAI